MTSNSFTQTFIKLSRWIIHTVNINILILLFNPALVASFLFLSWSSDQVIIKMLLSVFLGPSLIAGSKIFRQFIENSNTMPFLREFWSVYRQNFKIGLKIGLLFIGFLVVFFYNLNLILINQILSWLFWPLIIFMILTVYLFFYACILTSSFYLTARQALWNALILFFRYPIVSLQGLFLMTSFYLFVFYFRSPWFYPWIISAPLIVLTLLLLPIIKKLETENK